METKFIGKTVDSYQILDVVGRGGMGIVYKAKDLMLEKDVAVKMMDARLDPEGRLLKRFQDEARALAKLQHPNIVAIYALRESELGLCIVMELVSGKNLAEIIKATGAMPLERFKRIFLQCLNALDHAHKEGIVHRDIKPSNIMLTDRDVVKITDFGLAKRLDPSANASTMLVGGTLYYSPPEQLDSLANVDYRGDIYSLGMTMYEALTGKIPFADTSSDFKIRQAIVDGTIPPPNRLRPDLPDGFVQLVMKAIHNDPAKRFRSAAAMLEALEECETSPSPVSRRKPLPIKKLVIGLLGLAVAVVLYLVVPSFFGPSTKTVTGTLIIAVRGLSGATIPGASIVVDPIKDSPDRIVELTDGQTDRTYTGKMRTRSDSQGKSNLRYRVPPETRFLVEVDAEGYSPVRETIEIPRDSMVVVLNKLAPGRERERTTKLLTVMLRDATGNPVPSATINIQGSSGREYSVQTDAHGGATLEYPLASDGDRPTVRVAVERLRNYFKQSKARPTPIGSDMVLNLDINEFIAYDQTLKNLRRGSEAIQRELRGIKQRVTVSENEKRSDPDYRRAEEYEAQGERQLNENDFEVARNSFLQARDLYARAAEKLSSKRAKVAAETGRKEAEVTPSESRETIRKETPRKQVTQADVQHLLARYKNSLETGNLTGLSSLLHLSSSEESAWSKFFEAADDVRVAIEDVNVQGESDNAQLRFRVRISFNNRTQGGQEQETKFAMSLGLQNLNGKWEIVSHQ